MNCRDYERLTEHVEPKVPKIGIGHCGTCKRFGPEISGKLGYHKCLLGAMEGEVKFEIEPPLEVQETFACWAWRPAMQEGV